MRDLHTLGAFLRRVHLAARRESRIGERVALWSCAARAAISPGGVTVLFCGSHYGTLAGQQMYLPCGVLT
ncbi:hypothetical protein [Amycolatopsis magusensis]|uniref:hypothetical protein n=1 Tax=Amycolatopsis magusensis TaxID=882444 RepID=UPI003C309872